MAKIATCPQCAKQLGLPDSLSIADRVECPECQTAFSLVEAVQVSLPVARVLGPADQSPTPIDPPAVELPAIEVPSPQAEGSAPRQSWEERLKKALATSTDEEATTSVDEAPQELPEESKAAKPSPNFEFEPERNKPEPSATKAKLSTSKADSTNFDLPASITETTAEKPQEATAKTLADFAAAADIPSLDLDPPKAETQEQPSKLEPISSLTNAAAGLSLSTKRGNLDVDLAPIQNTEDTAVESAEAVGYVVARQRIQPSRAPKLAAMAAGPVLGTLFGLYGLLWLQGAPADYIGMSRILPASLLPTDFGEVIDDEQQLVADVPEEDDSTALSAARALMAKSETKFKRDDNVQTVSAAQPLTKAATYTDITSTEFSNLVDDARAAVTNLTAGDLTSPRSIKSKGQAYMTLCRLAEHYEFANQTGLAPDEQAKAKQAQQVFQRIVAYPDAQADLAHIALRWWGYEQRPSAGIFLLGSVQKVQPVAAGTIYWLQMGNESSTEAIPALLKQPEFQVGDKIGIVGRVTSSASEMPAGLSASQMVEAVYGYQLTLGL